MHCQAGRATSLRRIPAPVTISRMEWLRSVVTPPSGSVVDLAVVKAHLRVTHDTEDNLIGSLVEAAATNVEQRTNRLLRERTLDLRARAFPIGPIVLPVGPLASVTEVAYLATVDQTDETVLDDSAYTVVKGDNLLPRVVRADSWPGIDAVLAERFPVRVRAVLGYEPADIPKPMVQALLLVVGEWYETREDAPLGAYVQRATDSLLAPYVLSGSV